MSDANDLVKQIEGIKLDDIPPYSIVDNKGSLAKMIDALVDLPSKPPSIYVDLEGVNLSRHGTISIMQLYSVPAKHTYLVDVHKLQKEAFLTTGAKSKKTLEAVLEDATIPKGFFDIRNDSNAMFFLYDIKVAGVEDIQLMEIATRTGIKRCVNGLARCIESDTSLGWEERRAWKATKEKGKKMFAPDMGGTYEVFNERPLPESLAEYCAQDVQYLAVLWAIYDRKMTPQWATKVKDETKARIRLSQTMGFNGKSRDNALAPTGWNTGGTRRYNYYDDDY